ncbi:MAG: RsmE family RNA methyltransferase [Bryobacteraceae bacterium]
MSRRRFFVEGVHRGQAELTGEEAKHLTRVLRVEVGQHYEISDNERVWLAEVESARKEHVVFRVMEPVELRPESVAIHVYAAIIKFDHFEWMIEKATELGAARIIAVIATRTEHGLERGAVKRVERWRRIALEASQQSRRDRLPEIAEAMTFRASLKAEADVRLVLDEARTGVPLLAALPPRLQAADTVALLIGPEGGWTDEERAGFGPAGWRAVSLGPLILRAETAAMAAVAVVSAAWESAVRV